MKCPRRKILTAQRSAVYGRLIVTLNCGHRTVVRAGKGGSVPKSAACTYCGEGF